LGPQHTLRHFEQFTQSFLTPKREKMRAIRKSAICLLILLLVAGAAAKTKPKQIQIGTFVFHGTTDPNCGQFCNAGYEVLIDASAITGDVLSFGNILVAIGTVSQDSGPETTPIDLVFVGGAQPFVLPELPLKSESTMTLSPSFIAPSGATTFIMDCFSKAMNRPTMLKSRCSTTVLTSSIFNPVIVSWT